MSTFIDFLIVTAQIVLYGMIVVAGCFSIYYAGKYTYLVAKSFREFKVIADTKITLRWFKDVYKINPKAWKIRRNDSSDSNSKALITRITYDPSGAYVYVPWYSYLGLHLFILCEYKKKCKAHADETMCGIIKGVQADIDKERARIEQEIVEAKQSSTAVYDRLAESTKNAHREMSRHWRY